MSQNQRNNFSKIYVSNDLIIDFSEVRNVVRSVHGSDSIRIFIYYKKLEDSEATLLSFSNGQEAEDFWKIAISKMEME